MTEKQQVEKIASEVLSKKKLDWIIASVEENKAFGVWDIEVQTQDGRELILSIPNGSTKEMKESIKQQTDEETDRLKSH
jgi:phosphopantothenoylcysteine synthetase/decarboxylase